ncbi:MAG: hypothetical protein HY906_27340 [Deltaproteobacteria bacterium]|nr:hypothetical protein [Deltaproteobacteria bacterium]
MPTREPPHYRYSNLSTSFLKVSPLAFERQMRDKEVERVADQICRLGLARPLVVRPWGRAERYHEVLVDALTLAAAKAAGLRSVPGLVVRCNDQVARAIVLAEAVRDASLLADDRARAQDELKHWLAEQRRLEEQDLRHRQEVCARVPVRRPSGAAVRPAKPTPEPEAEVAFYFEGAEDLRPSIVRAVERGLISVEQAQPLRHVKLRDQLEAFQRLVQGTVDQDHPAEMDEAAAEGEAVQEELAYTLTQRDPALRAQVPAHSLCATALRQFDRGHLDVEDLRLLVDLTREEQLQRLQELVDAHAAPESGSGDR